MDGIVVTSDDAHKRPHNRRIHLCNKLWARERGRGERKSVCRSRYELYIIKEIGSWVGRSHFALAAWCCSDISSLGNSSSQRTLFACDTMHFSIIPTNRKAPHSAVAYSALPFHRIQFHIIIMRRFRFTRCALFFLLASFFSIFFSLSPSHNAINLIRRSSILLWLALCACNLFERLMDLRMHEPAVVYLFILRSFELEINSLAFN